MQSVRSSSRSRAFPRLVLPPSRLPQLSETYSNLTYMDKTTTFPSPSELIEIVARYRKALDDIYNHSDEAREAVVKHFGTVHPEIPASLRPEQGDGMTQDEFNDQLVQRLMLIADKCEVRVEDAGEGPGQMMMKIISAARSAGAEEERKRLALPETLDNFDAWLKKRGFYRSDKNGKWQHNFSLRTSHPHGATLSELFAIYMNEPTASQFPEEK